MPIAQQQIMRSECDRDLGRLADQTRASTPLSSTIASQLSASQIGTQRLEAFGLLLDEVVGQDLAAACARSSSSISFMMPLSSATSPLILHRQEQAGDRRARRRAATAAPAGS